MKRRETLAARSVMGAMALSFLFISHELANIHAWTAGSSATMYGPQGGFGLENQKAVGASRNWIIS
jgi:hypothetical protein